MVTVEEDTRIERLRKVWLMAISGAQFVADAIPADALWLTSTLDEMRRLQRTSYNMPGVGDLRIADGTVDCAGRVLRNVRECVLRKPEVTRVSGGGLLIVWGNDDKQVELTIFPNDQVLLSEFENGELLNTRELGTLEYGQVQAALKSL